MSSRDQMRHPLAVLVVDDEPDTATSLAELLALYGHTVRVALDGKDALRQATEEPPDVVFLDIRMPGLDGCRVAQILNEGAGGKRPLLVALTGCGMQEDRLRSAQAGFDLHLVKPVDPALLVGVLERFSRLLALPIPATGLDPLSDDSQTGVPHPLSNEIWFDRLDPLAPRLQSNATSKQEFPRS
ncbi:MAG: response regulator [Planctomycetia bacterium]|nr:response regulator [Planctomycetia bacterium]